MKSGLSIAFIVAFCLTCAAPITQFYPGTYFPEDHTYQNKSLGFSFSFRGNWDIICDPNNMKENKSNATLLHETGGELLFIGYTMEKTQGTRGIAVNLNETNRKYAEAIVKINQEDRQLDSSLTEMTIAGIPMIEWIYEKAGFRFVEFFFKVDTYNVRIAFWTKQKLFTNFLPVYEENMGTMILTER
jgi:hypothetical protein